MASSDEDPIPEPIDGSVLNVTQAFGQHFESREKFVEGIRDRFAKFTAGGDRWLGDIYTSATATEAKDLVRRAQMFGNRGIGLVFHEEKEASGEGETAQEAQGHVHIYHSCRYAEIDEYC